MNSILNNLSPKQSFFAGLVGAILALCTIGFFVLLVSFFNGGFSIEKNSAANNQPSRVATAPQPTTPTPSAGGQVNITLSDDDWVKGNPDAPITVVEFSDLECPFCKRFHPTVEQLLAEYPNEVNWVYRHFPLDSLHRKARPEAVATECAGELGGNDGFWAMTDRIFAETPSNDGLDLSLLPQFAEDIGLDRGAFEACQSSGRHDQRIQQQYDQAIAAGGRGTPFSVIVAGDQNVPVSGAVPYQQLKSVIDSLR